MRNPLTGESIIRLIAPPEQILNPDPRLEALLKEHKFLIFAGEAQPGARFPCILCGHDIGWNAPSGVCSEACLRRAQGFKETR